MPTVIEVEELSKKFLLKHTVHNRGEYSTFRDIFTHYFSRGGKQSTQSSQDEGVEEFWALQGVNFQIQCGEKVSIIGKNGAGKSTLLKILSRIVEPSLGRVRIIGRVASLLEVGTGFHPELTGRENIFFNGSVLGMSHTEISRSFDSIVDFANVERFLDTPVKHYSSGMYVRLGFAIAAHLETEIMIIDEILAVGDAHFQKKCLGKLQDIGREGRTILFVSHNMSSVLQFTDRAIVLEEGRIVFDGPSEEGVMTYLRVNESTSNTDQLLTKVTWLKINQFAYSKKSTQLGFNTALQFILCLTVSKKVPDIIITIGISNSVGARIITSKGIITGLSSGYQHINLDINEHRLIPGIYFTSLILACNAETVYSGEQILSFELLADDIDDPLFIPFLVRGKDRLGCYCPMEIHRDAPNCVLPDNL